MLGDWLAAIAVLFLALCGCVWLIRRVCLWVVRCPRSVACYRLIVPHDTAALAPLFRCLQAQAAWSDACTDRTLVLLPPQDDVGGLLEKLIEQYPAVVPVTAQELAVLAELYNDV